MTVVGGTTTDLERQCASLIERFPSWRIGRGGSGRWWAVRDTECVWVPTLEVLEAELIERG